MNTIHSHTRNTLLTVILLGACALWALPVPAADQGADPLPSDPLPSWQDGPVKLAILSYLQEITDPGHPDFIPANERVAVLDNDGTFWCERPDYASTQFQRRLLMSRIRDGHADPDTPPYPAWRDYDRKALGEYGWSRAYAMMNRAFAGMPVQAYRDSAVAFLDSRPHSEFKVRYTELYYRPMLQLARLLEQHGFQVWVVTGAEQDFVRSYIEQATGIPPERVIGSWTPAVALVEDGTISIVRDSVQVYNGHEHKPANIETRIGRRPVFAAGNSNNDQPMCLYAVTGPRRGLALWIHHDDKGREYSYNRGTGRMADLARDHDAAWEVSMKKEWREIFKEGVQR